MIIGRNYWENPPILIDQLKQMTTYDKKKMNIVSSFSLFAKIYLVVFGIPEVGVQLRAFYLRNFLNDLRPNFNPRKIFDAGCGIGIYIPYLKSKYPGARYYGTDIEKKKVNFVKKFFNSKDNYFWEGNLEKIPSKDKYDLILSVDVLEHVNDYKKVISNLSKVCNKNGYIFVHTHLIPKNWLFKSTEEWEHKEHVREGFYINELLGTMKKSGFKIIKYKKSLGKIGSFAFEIYLMCLKTSIILAAIAFPFLSLISFIDYYIYDNRGNTIAILAKKI